MSDHSDHPTTERASPPLGYEFRKALPTIVMACLAAVVTSWWNTQLSQADLRYRLDAVERQVKTNSENIAAATAQIQNQAIKFAEVGVTQSNMLEQLREIRQEQEDIKKELRGKR